MDVNTPVPDPGKWVNNYADFLFGYAISRLNNEEQAKDLVQETFLAALERLGTFENRSTERTWLVSILKNKIVDAYRKKAGSPAFSEIKAIEEQQDFFDEDTGHWKSEHQPLSWGADGNALLTNKEFNSILQKCMQKLPPMWMSVFSMKHLDDTPTETICTELKLSAANFWVIIHRAKLNLRACLQKHWL
ncbi:RNA polymerase factor sigma-70 [Mucilaginibacter gynuensis]|uniref:RNA polymerase factor sigma-70 n=1 Tax=Mucilaginibacter gynuensis TaxID=1302236 RepID=A0ABP8GJH0_9SPHI